MGVYKQDIVEADVDLHAYESVRLERLHCITFETKSTRIWITQLHLQTTL